jgi:hypothetical protein
MFWYSFYYKVYCIGGSGSRTSPYFSLISVLVDSHHMATGILTRTMDYIDKQVAEHNLVFDMVD